MPFITHDKRDQLDFHGAQVATEVGDLCYLAYKALVASWLVSPRWSTAHKLYEDHLFIGDLRNYPNELFDDGDLLTARALAWQVFFALYVMPYELKKQAENGDIAPLFPTRKETKTYGLFDDEITDREHTSKQEYDTWAGQSQGE